ncbi:MAG TPA: type III-A CRISPR-associated RAMP protein Csm3 [Leptospiraceae bacterium]|nr:type III-A CRISPR-associated RAMP protein Csm3 [Leptospiraceae bacterium]
MKLIEIKKITGTIELLSGLHIGAGKDNIEIGGVDMPVVKDSIKKEPYIPGSSLKGKMRSLLEWKLGEIGSDGDIKKNPTEQDIVARIFGHTNKELKSGPTRIIIRDALLNKEQLLKLASDGNSRTEVKYENTINRLTSEANPRQQERAVSGLNFDIEIIYKIFDLRGDSGNTDRENFKYIKQALKLVELDALGGGGSRGNGKIKFHLKDENGVAIDLDSVKLN